MRFKIRVNNYVFNSLLYLVCYRGIVVLLNYYRI